MKLNSTPSTPSGTRRRRGLAVALVLALLAVPAAVLASHQFGDVPTSNPFHANISRLVDTGITAGCGGGNYCPKSAVTREQMAAFLTRGLGNTAASYNELSVADAATSYVTDLTIRAGGATGGTGYITVTGDVSVGIFDTGLCPCGISIGIDQLNGPGTSPQTRFVVTDDELEGTRANAGTIQWVFEVPSGANARFGLYADVFTQPITTDGGGTAGAPAEPGVILGTMTAEYSPFGTTTVFGASESDEGWLHGREPNRRDSPAR
jgi:hypothetical protein